MHSWYKILVFNYLLMGETASFNGSIDLWYITTPLLNSINGKGTKHPFQLGNLILGPRMRYGALLLTPI